MRGFALFAPAAKCYRRFATGSGCDRQKDAASLRHFPQYSPHNQEIRDIHRNLTRFAAAGWRSTISLSVLRQTIIETFTYLTRSPPVSRPLPSSVVVRGSRKLPSNPPPPILPPPFQTSKMASSHSIRWMISAISSCAARVWRMINTARPATCARASACRCFPVSECRMRPRASTSSGFELILRM